jgi:hypothetical protein
MRQELEIFNQLMALRGLRKVAVASWFACLESAQAAVEGGCKKE